MYPSCPLSENIYTDTRHTKERRRVCEGVSKEPDDIFSHLLSRPLHEAIPEELDVRPARSRHHHHHHYRQLILHRPVHNRMKRPRDRCLVHIKWLGRGSGERGQERKKERREKGRGRIPTATWAYIGIRKLFHPDTHQTPPHPGTVSSDHHLPSPPSSHHPPFHHLRGLPATSRNVYKSQVGTRLSKVGDGAGRWAREAGEAGEDESEAVCTRFTGI